MKTVKITALKQTEYKDLIEKYENKIQHTCEIKIGDIFISYNARKPENLCDEAWKSMKNFVEELARGGGNFFDGWMRKRNSAMISCNDGFRPVSFYIETID